MVARGGVLGGFCRYNGDFIEMRRKAREYGRRHGDTNVGGARVRVDTRVCNGGATYDL